MTTLINVTITKTLYHLIGIIVIVIFILLLLINNGATVAEGNRKNLNMHDLIQNLADKNYSMYFAFVTPYAEEKGWVVPDDIKTDGRIVGQIQIREIGEDHVCINMIGDGIVDVHCIPFSNIASINYSAPDTSDK